MAIDLNPDDAEVEGSLDDHWLSSHVVDWAKRNFPAGEGVKYHLQVVQEGPTDIRLGICLVGSGIDSRTSPEIRTLLGTFMQSGYAPVGYKNVPAGENLSKTVRQEVDLSEADFRQILGPTGAVVYFRK